MGLIGVMCQSGLACFGVRDHGEECLGDVGKCKGKWQ